MGKKVFVTYSWDSSEHQKWVMMLTNTLREKEGIDGTFDLYELEGQNRNLNRMMVENIHTHDYIVIVLTEGYARKANEELGGVGFESTMLMDIIKNPEERNKIIILNRHKGDYSATIPDFLRGYPFIDVTDNNLDKGYEDLVRRIKSKPRYVKPKLGKGRELKPEEVGTFTFGGIDIPDLTPITPQSKETYMKEAFEIMLEKIEKSFAATKKKNSNFNYKIEDNLNHYNIKMVLEGESVKDMNLWLGSFGGLRQTKESILYQNNSGFGFSPSSMNGQLNVEVGRDEKLKLVNGFGVYGNEELERDQVIDNFIQKEFIDPLKSHRSNRLISRY